MPRANRHYLPGYVWHITHRCHKREFLLKFARDQRRWLRWLFEAKKRFGTSILNYTVTSNHIHLIVRDGQEREVIPETIQLVAGRTGQEYNQRKNRKGAFWEDRYHATAIEADFHLGQCMVYVDLNTVRAGVVTHPSEWPFCGYNEIQNPRQRYSLIDRESLIDLFGIQSMDEFKKTYKGCVEEALEKQSQRERQPRWTESIAVGSEAFVRDVKGKLGAKGMWREVIGANRSYELREATTAYGADFGLEKGDLRQKNTFHWGLSV
ncbi:MAG: transposase [Deltaproteobacteria bacterium]|nr:transposase [Deltaproteobacteria bacterium]